MLQFVKSIMRILLVLSGIFFAASIIIALFPTFGVAFLLWPVMYLGYSLPFAPQEWYYFGLSINYGIVFGLLFGIYKLINRTSPTNSLKKM